MSDSDSEPASGSGQTASPSTLNDQVRDAVSQVSALLDGQGDSFARAVLSQSVVHSVALAMHNAVAQQQQAHALRNAVTTAATRALLDGRRQEAEAVLKLAESPLLNPNVADELARLEDLLRRTLEQWRRALAEAKPAAAPSSA